jgi:heme exporter protein D
MRKFGKLPVIVRLIATAVLLLGGWLSIVAGLMFLLFGGVYLIGSLVGFFVPVLFLLAIWQVWKKPKFSFYVWFMLALPLLSVAFANVKAVYQNIVFRDQLSPIPVGTNTIELAYIGHVKKSDRVLPVLTAMRAGFENVYLDDEQYRKIGNGAYLRVAAAGTRPRYKVIEQVVVPNVTGTVSWPNRGDINIHILVR